MPSETYPARQHRSRPATGTQPASPAGNNAGPALAGLTARQLAVYRARRGGALNK